MQPLRRGIGGLRRRPALVPGKTLSNSDFLWFEPPWAGVRPHGLGLPSNSELGDAPGQLQPFLRYASNRLPELPLWNPHIAGGRPFLANGQSAVFSPYNLPAYVLPFWTALGWIAVLKLWLAGFGMFLLGRALGMRFGGALLTGIVYAFSLWMVTWLSYPHMSVWTWIPWMLLLTDQLVRRPDLLSGAGLSAVVAVQFLGGHPESSFHAVLTMVAFFLMRLAQARRSTSPQPAAGRTLVAFGAATAGGVALSALVLLPFGELLWHSADLRARQGSSIDHGPLLRRFALGIALPDYWGRPTATPLRPFLLDRALYAGALPLMLAAAAVVIRPRFERVCVALFGGLWLAVLFGIPPFLQIITRLPVFSSGHNSRLTVLYVLALALLAGWGLDDLAGGRWWRRRRLLVLGLSAAALALPALFVFGGQRTTLTAFGDAFRVAWGFVDPPGVFLNPNGGRDCVEPCTRTGDVIRLASLIEWLTLAGGGLVLVWLRFRRRLAPTPFVVLAVALVCVDLFRAGLGYNPAIDRKHASQPATGAIRVLERQGSSRFASMDPIPQNTIPMGFGLYEARGYDFPILSRFDHLWRREVSPESPSLKTGLIDLPLSFRKVTTQSLHTLRLLGVTHVMQPAQAPVVRSAGLRVVYAGRDARVYRLAGALPRAFVVPAQRLVSGGDAAFDAITHPRFDGRRVAVTERRAPGLPDTLPGRAGGAGNDARIARYEPERVVIRSRSAGPGMLVLSDNYFPGWKAKLDGRQVPIQRVDYVLRGVRIGSGAHTVEFRYEPLSWRIGWIVTLISSVGLLVALVVGWRRRRGRGAPPESRPGGPVVAELRTRVRT
jgi:Bacterial membrane protein YfhO